mmetsp:Transcript_46882/g.92279  ORF Transcript_46882/g.92279 Transcript_46882/m.92279 type:complete len:317 (-) Transcript_46882:65-1015(-)|eukprot:CAMPEP_0175157360 /NCGR_PEP_ID=MMETSP0087-20121206/22161_1 /TAXON_ID=136419 /ORGANISM="Unknown Unknown, Strain D1" /LENGTH=316 /DNA_ID=CAMNT_0016444965 /DNA_START=9 /DNA_END=959 /DNA_ORIENTATION=-
MRRKSSVFPFALVVVLLVVVLGVVTLSPTASLLFEGVGTSAQVVLRSSEAEQHAAVFNQNVTNGNDRLSQEQLKECQDILQAKTTQHKFFSQFGQDAHVFYNYFGGGLSGDPSKQKKGSGFYVDVAAALPKDLSNTYFFDKCLGWRGICIEAHPGRAKRLKRDRGCVVVDTCVSQSDGEKLTFWAPPDDESKNSWGTLSNGFVNPEGFGKKLPGDEKVQLVCKTMATIFAENNVTHVDFLSVDVESLEPVVLQSIDWSFTRVEVITVEMNRPEQVHAVLEKQGFEQHLRQYHGLEADAVYARPGVKSQQLHPAAGR